jgi:lipoprotein signal peptidase
MATTFDAIAGRGLPVPVAARRISLFGAAVAFMLFYMIAFPKGGIKAGGVPLTIGYAFTPVLMALVAARGRGLSVPLDRLLALTSCAALAAWSAVVVNMNGAESAASLISYFVTVVYLPLFGLVTFSSLLLDDGRRLVERTLVWAVRTIVVFGIFLFVFKQATGHWIEIPFVTVNVGDTGNLDDKMINRGGIFKLISTYNNGNIFGVCVLVMAPLYLLLEERRLLRGALYLALFLTLSRTAWIGMALLFAIRSFASGVRPTTILSMLVGAGVGLLFLTGLLSAMGRDLSFLWDSNLGGRIGQLDALNDIRIIPDQTFEAIPEIAYLGFIQFFGVPGLLFFLAYLATPPLLLWLEGVRPLSLTPAAACLQGMVLYMIIAGADAAFGLIPVMMIFWMIAGLGFWYAHEQARRAQVGRTRAAAR